MWYYKLKITEVIVILIDFDENKKWSDSELISFFFIDEFISPQSLPSYILKRLLEWTIEASFEQSLIYSLELFLSLSYSQLRYSGQIAYVTTTTSEIFPFMQ